MQYFDVNKELKTLKEQTELIKKIPYTRRRKSRLDKFKEEILALQKKSATTAEIKRFLHLKKIKVSHSTVARWLKKHG